MINNKTLIFGHKNPDTDSILSSIVMANLENELGNEAVPVRLGKINKETEYVFNYLQIERPEEISDIEDGQNVILVDHNECTQSANNISNANILKVVDHHTMNFVAPYQLYYRAEPVGCTATVLYKMYKEYDVEISKTIATLMVSSIISDTLLFKSPTCTKEDKMVAEKLANIAEIDLEVYGKELLKAGTDISEFTPEQVINIDSKLFEKGGKKFKIAQINTADLDDVFKNKAYFETAINNEIANENLDLYVFAATDILNSNSKIITLGNDAGIVEKAYGVTLDDHTAMLENVVSRKKQMLPKILENLD
ncbi:MAG TPA: manganese-dependent inorganic pyrophosphatase [Clostridiales bacterium]|nr:manganese-dependent inorganic pyrophosphatase [Clostridiales bacterium]